MSEGQFRPEDFKELLEALPEELRPVICCGQAVIALAEFFVEDRSDLGLYGSLTSKDLDLAIKPDSYDLLHSMKSELFEVQLFRDPRQPLYGYLIPKKMPGTRVDILKSIHGLHMERDRVFEDAILLKDTIAVPVISPVTQFIAKAANCGSIPQIENGEVKRNDIRHLRIMKQVLHAFFTASVAQCDPESKTQQRDIMRQMKQIQAAVEHSSTIPKGLQLADVSLIEAIPLKMIMSGPHVTLKRFLEGSYIPWLNANFAH